MSDEYRIRKVLRAMAWERMKGELNGILSTFCGEEEEDYDITKKLFEKFIKKIEEDSPLG